MAENKIFNRKLFFDHLLITLIILIICWGVCIICGINGITKEKHTWINVPYILGAFSTTIASYIALKKNNEVSGFSEWIKTVFSFKQGIFAYFLAVLLPAIYLILTCMIGGYEKVSPVYMIFPMIPVMIIGGGLEEAGWRYITFPQLERKFGFVISAIITAVIWWFWHLPLFFIPGVSQYQRNFFVFGLGVLALSFMLACIRRVTGSVWLCVLCHSIINAALEVWRYDLYGNALVSVIVAVVMIIISVIIINIRKKKSA